MKPPQSRKLRVTPSNDDVPTIATAFPTKTTGLSSPKFQEPTTMEPPPAPSSQRNHPTSPFDSSMALTVLVLLVALFFMGFFSIYIRKFSSSTDATSTGYSSRRRRRQHQGHSPAAGSTYGRESLSRVVTTSSSRKGLDPEIVKSLPVYTYYHVDGKYQTQCAICLGEFEEKERAKLIPKCKHLFHLDCIDTWLQMHVSCPVCRGTQFFEVLGKDGNGGDSDDDHGTRHEVHGRWSGMDNCNDVLLIEVMRQVGALGLSRSNSCSILSEKASLQRTSSF
ncbi:hypothetical protein Tsubulata_010853 [Turnera subulata]|uniref:RING-type E3 ubiquitin transferase n=1 Tax=Turnera subulata TaxID=218843 RepID=A0A9Q0FSH8_9ROSI|nr:hypothetical protein Tsubulata_010853 [Turnera subulata]